MSFLKIITLCDDELLPESRAMLKKYDISAYPAIYFCGKTPYIDTINTDAETFYRQFTNGEVTSLPAVHADLLEHELHEIYNNGYFGVIFVTPHNKWYDFKHQAEIAKKRFFRKTEIDEHGFFINFIDTKSFAGGMLAQVRKYAIFNKSSCFAANDFYNLLRSEKYNKFTYILSKDENAFDDDKGLKAYIIKNNKITRMNISHYSDSVIYDLFVGSFIKQSKGCEYNVSLGPECYFAGNVLGRIESLTGVLPSSTIKYGVSTANILGLSAICVSFEKFIGISSKFEHCLYK